MTLRKKRDELKRISIIEGSNFLFSQFILFSIALLLLLPSIGQAQSIAFSFDDGLDPRNQPLASSWNASILKALSNAQIESILFAAGNRVDSPAGLKLVEDWSKAGHAVANHTYSHPNFCSERTTLKKFITDTERNELLLKNMPGWTKRLRFPYLKEGETIEKRDGFRNWLTNHGYKSGAVSIDASDWYYNKRYLAWRVLIPRLYNRDFSGYFAPKTNPTQ